VVCRVLPVSIEPSEVKEVKYRQKGADTKVLARGMMHRHCSSPSGSVSVTVASLPPDLLHQCRPAFSPHLHDPQYCDLLLIGVPTSPPSVGSGTHRPTTHIHVRDPSDVGIQSVKHQSYVLLALWHIFMVHRSTVRHKPGLPRVI